MPAIYCYSANTISFKSFCLSCIDSLDSELAEKLALNVNQHLDLKLDQTNITEHNMF